jgi:hypothetical protein
VLVFSTYLGGIEEDTIDWGIALDRRGNIYVTGTTRSPDFPTTLGAFQPAPGLDPPNPSNRDLNRDVFVAKLNPDGLVYSTYLGGSRADLANHIAVDASGNAYVTGATASLDFPTTADAFRVKNAGGLDAFVTKLNADGSGLVYSTYLGGAGVDIGTRIVLGHSGEVYVAGNAGIDFPTTPGAFQTVIGGAPDGFVTKLNPTGSALVYSTYLGGRGEEQSLGIALNTAGNAFGRTDPLRRLPDDKESVPARIRWRGSRRLRREAQSQGLAARVLHLPRRERV